MKERILGKTGFKISEIGLGCWQLGNDFGPVDDNEAKNILNTAWEQGINFWDTADVYGGGLSEERIGAWLKETGKRPYVVTKVGRNATLYPNGYKKQAIKDSLVGSIKRLGVESLDLAQLHCVPKEVLFDGEVFNHMEDMVQDGIIQNFGASVESVEEGVFAISCNSLSTLQIIFNIFRQDATELLLPKAKDHNIGVIIRLPLASGLLTGKMYKGQEFAEGDHRNYNRDGKFFNVGETFNGIPYDTALDLIEEVKGFLPDNLSILQVALRWILDNREVSSIIAGASRSSQVVSNASMSDLDNLSPELTSQLKEFYYNKVRSTIRGVI